MVYSFQRAEDNWLELYSPKKHVNESVITRHKSFQVYVACIRF